MSFVHEGPTPSIAQRGFAHLEAEVIRLAQELDRLRAQTTWQPMATCPKDGRRLLLCCDSAGRYVDVGHWVRVSGGPSGKYDWQHFHGGGFANPPIYWMPLPAPPEDTKKETP